MALVTNDFATPAELTDAFAGRILGILQHAIVEKGSATLVVSGGRTPQPLFAKLAEADIDWSKVTITLADDRWVPVTDDASNDKLVREHLLVKKSGRCNLYYVKTRFC